jgi:hypothetical protein
MTDGVGADAEPRPPRPRWVVRPLFAVLIVLAIAVLAVGGAWWFKAAKTQTEPAAVGSPSSAATAPSTPVAERPSAPERSAERSPRPLPPIPGTTVEAVAAGWAKLWGTAPKPSPRGYDTRATLPGTRYVTRFGVLRSAAGDDTVATLFCMTADQHLSKDQRLIRAVLDSCVAPALRDGEKTALLTWLSEQDYSRDVDAKREFPRFNVEVVSVGTAFQVRLVSKGRTVPGS